MAAVNGYDYPDTDEVVRVTVERVEDDENGGNGEGEG
jgi:hypothetical protein